MSIPVMKGYARLKDLPEEKIGEKITRRILVGEKEMVVFWKMKAGANATVHQHPHEQLFWVLSGKMEFDLAGDKRTCVAGDLGVMVFPLVNLPEVVKGALFARYSRSAKSLRRLFLDEFLEQAGEAPTAPSIGTTRAEQLYERVFSEYGDDSVAQLGGVHLACEGASNLLTKGLEGVRPMA